MHILSYRMLKVLFNVKLDGNMEGAVVVLVNEGQSLKEARGPFIMLTRAQVRERVRHRHQRWRACCRLHRRPGSKGFRHTGDATPLPGHCSR